MRPAFRLQRGAVIIFGLCDQADEILREQEYTGKAFNAATPLARDAANEAKKALESAGIDTSAAGQYVKVGGHGRGTDRWRSKGHCFVTLHRMLWAI